MGFIYLLHFDKPLAHAKHYLGYAEHDVDDRVTLHFEGKSKVKIIDAALKAGISFTIARTWENKTRTDERRMKKMGGKARFCPICKQQHK